MHEIYQIFYNESTQKSNDPGFLPSDNLSNERPDWSEYWPIRRFFTGRTLSPDTYYGFLSPKFHQKTGLSAQDVRTFLVDCTDDLVLLSPFLTSRPLRSIFLSRAVSATEILTLFCRQRLRR